MTLKIIPKTELSNWIELLQRNYRVIAPAPVQQHFAFKEVKSFSEMDLGYRTTILPPKKALSPQYEELMTFNNSENRTEAVIDDTPTVLFGVHTCDLHAINFLDTVFQRDYADQHYFAVETPSSASVPGTMPDTILQTWAPILPRLARRMVDIGDAIR
jgi:sulfhydrogenase subunit beta (sulfur reductase)